MSLRVGVERLVVDFGELAEEEFGVAGGKATNLAKMVQAGLRVPGGFVVLLSGFGADGGLTDEAKAQILAKLTEGEQYAVRSSATVEDSESESWAGQFESFLDVATAEVPGVVQKCHDSSRRRAKAYSGAESFDIAVVVQKMVAPDYSGVVFTTDPVTGKDEMVCEYVEGLGEALVSGVSDPARVVLESEAEVPFDKDELLAVTTRVRGVFGVEQDIEWASVGGEIWILQARPITAVSRRTDLKYDLGEPDELFYWGPSRATPLYMGDFEEGFERFFRKLGADQALPQPPKTVVLFQEGKVIYLMESKGFSRFVREVFEQYEAAGQVEEDFAGWRELADRVFELTGEERERTMIEAWEKTEMAEFALYGAEEVMGERLGRFEEKARREIWGAFTTPDELTFLNRLDAELVDSGDHEAMAEKYPWIVDGYSGLGGGGGGVV